MKADFDGRPLSDAPVAPPPNIWPERAPLEGPRVRLAPVDPAADAESLYELGHADETARALWTYLPYGPFDDLAAFRAWLEERAASEDPLFFTIHDKGLGRAAGMMSYLRITPEHGVIEIGHIWFSPPLQRTPAATEALFLSMQNAFDRLGNRRLEWKCNALNEASRRAALRLGFQYEGTFHQHLVVKGLNRDSAWFSILDHEWPRLRSNFETWLSPDNFDASGNQKLSLGALNAPAS